MPLSVVIIGAGNMSYNLACAFTNTDVKIKQVYNRSQRGLLKISSMTKVPTCTSIYELDLSADVYIIAVHDDAIPDVTKKLAERLSKGVVITHTSGSCTIEIFAPYFEHYGAFYPLQSLSTERIVDFEEVSVFISSSSESTWAHLEKLGKAISSKVIPISDEDRSKLHLPAVLVNNFVNHIYSLAYDICQEQGISFEHLIPLMEETINRLKEERHPQDFQTGPALRGDKKTINHHRILLESHPSILRLYNYLTRHIQEYHEDPK